MPLDLNSNPYTKGKYLPPLALEHKKAVFLKKIEAQLLDLSTEKIPKVLVQKPQISTKSKWKNYKNLAYKGSYYYTLVFGLIEDIGKSLTFSSDFFEQMPWLGNAAAIFLSIVFTILESILFYAFEVSLLKNQMELTSREEINSCLDYYQEQITTIKSINGLLKNVDVVQQIPYPEYRRCIKEVVLLANQDLKNKRATIAQHQKIPLGYNILKYSVIAFGGFSKLVGSFFMANSFFKVISLHIATIPDPILTPLIWVFFVLIAIAGLRLYQSMEAKSMGELVTPGGGKYAVLQEEFSNFQPAEETSFKNARHLCKKYTENLLSVENKSEASESSLERLSFSSSASGFFSRSESLSRTRSLSINDDLESNNEPLHRKRSESYSF